MRHTLKLAATYTDTASDNCHQLPAVYTASGILISHLRYLSWFSEKSERFPEDKIEGLIQHGFMTGHRPDDRSQAMTMLLNYGGLRKSEIFHIFTSDINIHPNDDGEALVRVYRPEYGAAPDPQYKTRAEYGEFIDSDNNLVLKAATVDAVIKALTHL